MNPEKLAALTPHGIDPHTIFGGERGLSMAEKGWMLKDCARDEELFLRVKYCQEGRYLHECRAYWFERVMAEGWQNCRQGIRKQLADVTLAENIGGLLCRVCNGQGQREIDSKVVVCENCAGIGRKHWSDRAMARELELTKLVEPWRSRVDWCRSQLRAWEHRAVRHLRQL